MYVRSLRLKVARCLVTIFGFGLCTLPQAATADFTQTAANGAAGGCYIDSLTGQQVCPNKKRPAVGALPGTAHNSSVSVRPCTTCKQNDAEEQNGGGCGGSGGCGGGSGGCGGGSGGGGGCGGGGGAGGGGIGGIGGIIGGIPGGIAGGLPNIGGGGMPNLGGGGLPNLGGGGLPNLPGGLPNTGGSNGIGGIGGIIGSIGSDPNKESQVAQQPTPIPPKTRPAVVETPASTKGDGVKVSTIDTF
jgi:hypothetical protein